MTPKLHPGQIKQRAVIDPMLFFCGSQITTKEWNEKYEQIHMKTCILFTFTKEMVHGKLSFFVWCQSFGAYS